MRVSGWAVGLNSSVQESSSRASHYSHVRLSHDQTTTGTQLRVSEGGSHTAHNQPLDTNLRC